MKSRSQQISVTGGYNASNAGRWIDMPDGGSVSVHGGTYTQVVGAQANVMGFAEESQKNGIGTFTVAGATVILARYNSQFMIPTGGTIAFTETTQKWSKDNGTAPSITVLNSGTLTGLATSPSGNFVSLPEPPAPSSGATYTTQLK